MADTIASYSPHIDFAHCFEAACGGSQESLGTLLVAFRPYLNSIAGRRLGGREHSKRDSLLDLFQETYLHALRGFGGFRGTTEIELRCWLRRILVNLIADSQLERAAWPERLPAHQEPMAEGPASSDTVQEEGLGEMGRAVAQLSEEYRTILLCRIRDKWTWDAIGLHLGKSADAARKVHFRALGHLREMLSSRGARRPLSVICAEAPR